LDLIGLIGLIGPGLNNAGQHYINIIDPAIAFKQGYQPYDEGMQMDIFIKRGVVSSKVGFLTPNHLHGKTCKDPPYANSVQLFKRQALLNKSGPFQLSLGIFFLSFLLIIKYNNISRTYIFGN
jgi:hypothetical protein